MFKNDLLLHVSLIYVCVEVSRKLSKSVPTFHPGFWGWSGSFNKYFYPLRHLTSLLRLATFHCNLSLALCTPPTHTTFLFLLQFSW